MADKREDKDKAQKPVAPGLETVKVPADILNDFIELKADAEAEVVRCKTKQQARVEIAMADMKEACKIPVEREVVFQGNKFVIVPGK